MLRHKGTVQIFYLKVIQFIAVFHHSKFPVAGNPKVTAPGNILYLNAWYQSVFDLGLFVCFSDFGIFKHI